MPREETIQIKIDKSLTTAPISELKKAAEELKKEFGNIKIGNTSKAMAEEAKAAKEAAKAAKEQANAAKANATALKMQAAAERELENATNAKLRAQKTAQQIATEQQRTEKEHANALKASAQAIKATDQAQNQLNKTMTSGVGLAKNMGSAMMSFTKQLIGFYGVTQVLRSALTEMKSMNDELTTYRKVTGATMQQMEAMRSKAYGAAKAYGQSPSDFLASAATMARAGYGETSAEMAELATKTQLVGDMTADAASQFLIAVDAAYKYKGNLEQLNSVLDSANELDNKYATTIEKISEGITLVASLAATAKVPIEQMMAALGTMTATTQRAGSEAARGFRYILLHAMGDTTTEIEEGVTATEEGVKTLTDAVMKYGDESVKNAVKAGKLINPMEKIVALQKAYKEGALSNEDLYDIGVKVAGVRQYNMFMALVQNPEMYNSMLNDIANSTGSAEREIAAMMDSWSKKLERFKATWTETVNKTIDDGLIKYFLDLGTQVLEFSGSLANLTGVLGGLYAAVKLFKSGDKLFAGGKSLGWLGFAVSGISLIKTFGENQFSNSVKQAEKSAEASAKLVTSTRNLGEAIRKYQEIAADGVIDNTELETAKSLQEQIKNLVGDTAKNWDLVNGNVKDNIKLLGDAAKTYAQNAYVSARSNTATAATGLRGANNSWLDMFTGAGLRFDKVIEKGKVPDSVWEFVVNSDAFTKTMRRTADGGWEAFKAEMKNSGPKDILNAFFGGDFNANLSPDEIVKRYDAAVQLRDLFASAYSSEELSKDAGFKDLINGISRMTDAVTAYKNALKEEQNALANQVLIEDGFLEKKFETNEAFYKYIDALIEAKGLTAEEGKTLLDMAKILGDVQDAAEDGADGFKGAAGSASELAKSINAAAEAKKKFDDAMKESKADAFNSYQEAYQTYQKELKEGRVNSTAFHAAARMVLGDEVYYSAGGDSKKIRGLMNKKGKSGSAQQAADILYGTYKDEKGNVIQGGGLWQLLNKTKGFDKSLLTDKNGNWQIPDLEPYMKLITSQWGNLTEEAIRGAWNALDQYDREGKNTSDKLKQQKEEEATSSDNATESANQAADAATGAAEAAQELADAETNAAQATQEAAEAKTEEEGQAEGGTPLEAGVEQSGTILSNMQQAYDLYLKMSETAPSINMDAQTLSFVESMEYLIAHPDILVNIQQGQNTGDAVSAFSGIASAIQLIEKYAGTEEGAGLTVNANIVGDLGEQLQTMYATLSEGQKNQVDAFVNLQDEPFKTELNTLLHPEEPYTAEVSVGADTELATDAADTAVTEINEMAGDVSVGGDTSGATSAADEAVKEINKKEATIDVKVKIHGVNNGNAYDYDYDENSDTLKYDEWLGFAEGTRNHPGGLSLVNDGTGPELILDRGRAFIAGNGGPTLVNLQKGAKVFTASETRSILSGNGVPAYATGTVSVSYEKEPGSVTGLGKLTLAEDEDTKKKTKKKARTKSKTKKEEVNEDAYKDLASMIDYIINRVGEALDEQLEIIDAQIAELQAARDAAKQQNELEERQKAVAEAQKDLAEALGERTVRYLGEDGKWHWMADARSVKSAQESLTKAQDSLREYEEDMAFNAQVEALENQKKVLQDEYDEITKTWSKIQDGVNTPTGEISKLIADVLKGGTDQEKKGATTAQNLLLNTLLGGGSYKGNYNEALSAISKATAGNPVMPGEANATLASLIAMSGAGGASGSVTDALKVGTNPISSGVVSGLNGLGGSQTNVNYFINGLQLGSDQANQPLSSIMKNLSVYTNTTVN